MNTNSQKWKPFIVPFADNLNDALQQQHHAAQFVALTGRYLIPQQPDDSNTNMIFVSNKDMLVGNALPDGLRVALNLKDLKISILGQGNDVYKEICLDGKTKQEAFDLLKQDLADLKIDVADFKNKLHYEIPVHQLDKGAAFSIKEKYLFIENSTYRHNAEIVINKISSGFKQAEPVRVWPHHFDTGSFTPLGHNNKGGISQSIGIGWAIPDSMVNEPYYYLSFWSENPVSDFKKLPPLTAGRWMTTGWNGGVLKHSEILTLSDAEEQYKHVIRFFNSGIEILKNQFKH